MTGQKIETNNAMALNFDIKPVAYQSVLFLDWQDREREIVVSISTMLQISNGLTVQLGKSEIKSVLFNRVRIVSVRCLYHVFIKRLDVGNRIPPIASSGLHDVMSIQPKSKSMSPMCQPVCQVTNQPIN